MIPTGRGKELAEDGKGFWLRQHEVMPILKKEKEGKGKMMKEEEHKCRKV